MSCPISVCDFVIDGIGEAIRLMNASSAIVLKLRKALLQFYLRSREKEIGVNVETFRLRELGEVEKSG